VAIVNTLNGVDVSVETEQTGLWNSGVFHLVLGVRGKGHCDLKYQAGGSNHDVIFKLPNPSNVKLQPGGARVVDP
jgi:hypothetical protein